MNRSKRRWRASCVKFVLRQRAALGSYGERELNLLKISNEARGRLLGLRRGPGYEDLVDLMAKLCEESERSLFSLDRGNGASTEQILSRQDQCRAQRIYMQNVLVEIEQQANRLVEDQAAKGAHPKPGEPLRGRIEPALDVQDAAEILGLIPDGPE